MPPIPRSNYWTWDELDRRHSAETGDPPGTLMAKLVEDFWLGKFEHEGVSRVFQPLTADRPASSDERTADGAPVLADGPDDDAAPAHEAHPIKRRAVARLLAGNPEFMPWRWDGTDNRLAKLAAVWLRDWPEKMRRLYGSWAMLKPQFQPSVRLLEPWLRISYAQLPFDAQQMIASLPFLFGRKREAVGAGWDSLSVDRRRELARQWDASHEPDPVGAVDFKKQARLFEIEQQIAERELMPALTQRDIPERDTRLAELRRERDAIRAAAEGAWPTVPTYEPDWLALAIALARLTENGAAEADAKAAICNAMADGKIRVRVKTEEPGPKDLDPVERALQNLPTGGGEVFAGDAVVVPQHLVPTDFDWINSRVLKPWRVRPRSVGERYDGTFQTGPWTIVLLELWREHVDTLRPIDGIGPATPYMARLAKAAHARAEELRAERTRVSAGDHLFYVEALKRAGPVLFGEHWIGPATEDEKNVLALGASVVQHPRFAEIAARDVEREAQFKRVENWLLKLGLVVESGGSRYVPKAALETSLAEYAGEEKTEGDRPGVPAHGISATASVAAVKRVIDEYLGADPKGPAQKRAWKYVKEKLPSATYKQVIEALPPRGRGRPRKSGNAAD